MKSNNEKQASAGKVNDTIEQTLPVLDLSALTQQAKMEEGWTTRLYSKTILKNDELRIMLIGIHEKSEIEMHEAEATTSIQVLDGELMFVTKDEVVLVDKGELITLERGTWYGLRAKEPTIFLMTMPLGVKK